MQIFIIFSYQFDRPREPSGTSAKFASGRYLCWRRTGDVYCTLLVQWIAHSHWLIERKLQVGGAQVTHRLNIPKTGSLLLRTLCFGEPPYLLLWVNFPGIISVHFVHRPFICVKFESIVLILSVADIIFVFYVLFVEISVQELVLILNFYSAIFGIWIL